MLIRSFNEPIHSFNKHVRPSNKHISRPLFNDARYAAAARDAVFAGVGVFRRNLRVFADGSAGAHRSAEGPMIRPAERNAKSAATRARPRREPPARAGRAGGVAGAG